MDMADTTPQLATCRSSLRTVTGWTIFFMVLLRISIGWHFFYEGAWKLVQEDWKATPYLTASSGPFRPLFRWMVKDVDGLERLTEESITQRMDERFDELVDHYNITDKQIKGLKIQCDELKSKVAALFRDPDFQTQLEDYNKFLSEIDARENRLGTMDYNKERLVYDYGKKNKVLNDLLATVEKPLRDLENNFIDACSVEQLDAGPPPLEPSQTEWIDWSNMLALTAVGVCLMLGLFTRLAALGGVGLLAMYYFAMPPWPGLPESPMAEGHYLIINKNLIEMIALLMIATSGIGRWCGLDAIVSRILFGKKVQPTASTPGSNG